MQRYLGDNEVHLGSDRCRLSYLHSGHTFSGWGACWSVYTRSCVIFKGPYACFLLERMLMLLLYLFKLLGGASIPVRQPTDCHLADGTWVAVTFNNVEVASCVEGEALWHVDARAGGKPSPRSGSAVTSYGGDVAGEDVDLEIKKGGPCLQRVHCQSQNYYPGR